MAIGTDTRTPEQIRQETQRGIDEMKRQAAIAEANMKLRLEQVKSQLALEKKKRQVQQQLAKGTGLGDMGDATLPTNRTPWQPGNLADVATLPGTLQAGLEAAAQRARVAENERTGDVMRSMPEGPGEALAQTVDTGPQVRDYARRVKAAVEAAGRGDATASGPGPLRGFITDATRQKIADYRKKRQEERAKQPSREEKQAAIKERLRLRGMAKAQGLSVGGLQAQEAAVAAQKVKQAMMEHVQGKLARGEELTSAEAVFITGPEMAEWTDQATKNKALGYGLNAAGQSETPIPESVEALRRSLVPGDASPGDWSGMQGRTGPSGGVTVSDGETSMSIPFTPHTQNIPRAAMAAIAKTFPTDIPKAFDALLATASGDVASAIAALKAMHPEREAEILALVKTRGEQKAKTQAKIDRRKSEEKNERAKGPFQTFLDKAMPGRPDYMPYIPNQ